MDTVCGQVQSLNDSVDELKARIAKLDKTVQDLQAQLQNMQAPPARSRSRAAHRRGASPGSGSRQRGHPGEPARPRSAQQAPPLQETLQAGVRDFNAGRYEVAAGEFQDVVHYYPLDELAGTAQFYLGEIAYQQKDYADAIECLQRGAGRVQRQRQGSGGATAQGLALLAENKREAGIHELRSVDPAASANAGGARGRTS